MDTIQQNTVSFFTNCYENDWEKVLIGDRLQEMISRCNYPFQERVLIVNNVSDRKKVEDYAAQAVTKGIIDTYYFTEDHAEEALKELNITRGSFLYDFHDGYWYSMGPLMAVYLCKSDYLLYFTCDCKMQENAGSEWIDQSITLFANDPAVFVANPVWDNNIAEAKKESFREDKDWFYSRGISDQCFLIKNSRLKEDVYRYKHKASERYPIYGGFAFERRLDSYIHQKNLVRATNKHVYYIHEKLLNDHIKPMEKKNALLKKVKYYTGKIKKKVRMAFS